MFAASGSYYLAVLVVPAMCLIGSCSGQLDLSCAAKVRFITAQSHDLVVLVVFVCVWEGGFIEVSCFCCVC